MKSLALALAIAFASVAVAAPPAPTITVAASNIRQLQFDITPVTQVNWYELWFKANPGAQWVKYAQTPAQRPIIRINASVHLLDWQQARYFVKACNPGGCSASNEVGVDGEQLAAMGYFKPGLPGLNEFFGFQFALSADGMTLVVLANEKIDHVSGRGAIYVYRKATSSSGWGLDARLLPSPDNPGAGSGSGDDRVAVSSDGKTIVTSNWVENDHAGGVYLFRRAADGWHQTQRITNNTVNDYFGISLKLDTSAKRLVIEHNAVGDNKREGTLDVYQDLDDGSDQFVYAATVPTPAFDDPVWGWCRAFAVSEGGAIVRSCFSGANLNFYTQVLEASAGTPLQYTEIARLPGGSGVEVAIDFAGERLLIQGYDEDIYHSNVRIFRRGASGWVKEATLAPLGQSGSRAALSGDGKIVAIGMPEDTLAGRGPLFPPYLLGDQTGTVAVYERRASGWALRRYVKAGANNYLRSFGTEVALDQYGHVLAVGSPYDPSKATGIDGDREDTSAPYRGAVWLY